MEEDEGPGGGRESPTVRGFGSHAETLAFILGAVERH